MGIVPFYRSAPLPSMGMGAEMQVLVSLPPPVVLWVVMVLWALALALVACTGQAPPTSGPVVRWPWALALCPGLGPSPLLKVLLKGFKRLSEGLLKASTSSF